MAIYINGERLKKSEIKEEVERMRPHYQKMFRKQMPEEQEKQLREWARENVIERYLLKQQAQKYRGKISKEKVEKAFDKFVEDNGGKERFNENFKMTPLKEKKIRADLELQLSIEKMLAEVCGNLKPPISHEIKKYYEAHRDNFIIPEEVRAAHIVKHATPQVSLAKAYKDILKVQNALKAGAKFEELADENSDCPGNGGDLGYFHRGEMVQEFEDVVFSMAIGEVSDIIRSGFGYHIAKLYDKKPARPLAFEHVKNEIIKKLTDEKREKRIEEFIDALKEKAIILEK